MTGFSLISGVEIVYFLAKFLISLLSRRNKIQECLQKITTFNNTTSSNENDSLTVKNLVEKNENLEEKIERMNKNCMEKLEYLQSDLELVQMREKQAELGDSNAAAFFDAIFKNKTELITKKDC